MELVNCVPANLIYKHEHWISALYMNLPEVSQNDLNGIILDSNPFIQYLLCTIIFKPSLEFILNFFPFFLVFFMLKIVGYE